ncbi:DUF2189 domain-containing protein [Acidimangrovimonas pyrenivorans]|uniref:DUF2189 domain-containing protein n=1 Tax=Acidimangrovimonas pyrenivorans TaxID=2030798 RepID=A0ABV7AFT8_9RHOB
MLEPLPTLRPPLRPPSALGRNLPTRTALAWFATGWTDFRDRPGPSLAYGLALLALSYGVLAALWRTGLLFLALPSLAGFLIVGPFLAVGLYEKSRRRAAGQTTTLGKMLLIRPRAGGQLAHAGLLLCLLVLFWLRAADLLYALFFGLAPVPGAEAALLDVLTTPRGWLLVVTGTGVGALFAAFAFATSVFAIPMLAFERRDALTALGLSFAMTARNLRVMLAWGAIVAAGLALSALGGLVPLAVLFPVLGHGTWHAYKAIRMTD